MKCLPLVFIKNKHTAPQLLACGQGQGPMSPVCSVNEATVDTGSWPWPHLESPGKLLHEEKHQTGVQKRIPSTGPWAPGSPCLPHYLIVSLPGESQHMARATGAARWWHWNGACSSLWHAAPSNTTIDLAWFTTYEMLEKSPNTFLCVCARLLYLNTLIFPLPWKP